MLGTTTLHGQTDRAECAANESHDHAKKERKKSENQMRRPCSLQGQPPTYELGIASTGESIYVSCDDIGVTNATSDACAWQDSDGLPLRGQTRIGRGTCIQPETIATEVDEEIPTGATDC